MIGGIASYFVGGFINGFTAAMNHGQRSPITPLFSLLGLGLMIAGAFTMRSDLEEYYNTTENINLRLEGAGSALLTLFFPVYYLQWHFSRIAKWKKTGVLTPQR